MKRTLLESEKRINHIRRVIPKLFNNNYLNENRTNVKVVFTNSQITINKYGGVFEAEIYGDRYLGLKPISRCIETIERNIDELAAFL